MAGIAIVLPILLIIIVMWRFKRMPPSKMTMNKKWTYLFLAAYIGVLIIATIAGDMLNSHHLEQPKLISEEDLNQFEEALNIGALATLAPSSILEKRTHEIGASLSISTNDEDSYPNITIEYKDVNDGLIEETIFKPQLVMDEYDLSDYFEYVLPKWTDDQVLFLVPPSSKVALISYDSAFLLKQFTSGPRESFGHSNSSMSRDIIVHLRVPKDLEIIADEHLYVDYVNE